MTPDPYKSQMPSPGIDLKPVVLFLCTGNYYRSRFAEELFNYHARKSELPLKAYSLGFTPHPLKNLGAMSVYALDALAARGIRPPESARMPAAVCSEDFSRYTYCIALSESEHLPMMQAMFPNFLSRVSFWQVEDLAWENPQSATAKIETNVLELLETFQKSSTPRI